jgi:hypothetical protein
VTSGVERGVCWGVVASRGDEVSASQHGVELGSLGAGLGVLGVDLPPGVVLPPVAGEDGLNFRQSWSCLENNTGFLLK